METKRIFRSALLCLLIGTCAAQFQQRQQSSYYRQPQPQQQKYYNQQQQQQPRSFNQRPNNNFVQQQQQQQQPKQQQFSQNSFSQPQQQQHFGGGQCPEPNGRFPVASQCDAYIECADGVAEEKLCPEGLLFNPEARFNYPCGYPIDVKCEGRSALQPANPTEECPHQFGYFKMGDKQNCGKFMNCVDGRGFVFDCPEGLAYNPETYRCDWPDQVSDCDAEAFLGFTCPTSAQNSETRFYRSPNDCQRYYVCVENRPRLQNCGEGHAFNEVIGACDAAENVTGCEPPTYRENLQTIPLDQNIDIRLSNDQPQNFRSANQQQNTFNQARNFGGFQQQAPQQQRQQQQQQYRGSQIYRNNNQGINNDQYSRSRFSTF